VPDITNDKLIIENDLTTGNCCVVMQLC